MLFPVDLQTEFSNPHGNSVKMFYQIIGCGSNLYIRLDLNRMYTMKIYYNDPVHHSLLTSRL